MDRFVDVTRRTLSKPLITFHKVSTAGWVLQNAANPSRNTYLAATFRIVQEFGRMLLQRK
jgi:hypothetical protein